MIDGCEVPKAHRQALGLDGDIGISRCHQGRHDHGVVVAPPFLRQQGDEGFLERFGLASRAQFGRCAGGQYLASVHRY